MAKHAKPSKGERVSWRSHGGTAVGRVTRRITGRTKAGGRTVEASPDDPQYEVRSEKSGGRAVHRPGALRGRGGGS
ncbi:DUF2945 domain-containing protein [Actinacidiphila acidipaludis]|uniref:DUF2945 domain-containing protein n=1 Tax=Actinacidiphila acidipaludis TaxID=2873382 RepID=A0ABS7Q7J5_9ACTN|nr:DUF2945 domain-containing protein [Streptomyces acidipaludis]MBY8878913.1 DUF2945 domain-containing protein [Streptomyces acidipaludis]